MTFEIPRYTLNDGQSVPVIGFGTYPLRGDDGVEAMVHALEAGYRLLDTAVNYGNEEEVGEAVRRSGLPREDIQVTSKIPGRHHEYDQAIGSVEESLRRMRFDYLDRVLIHSSDSVSLGHQLLDQMTPNKAATTGDDRNLSGHVVSPPRSRRLAQ